MRAVAKLGQRDRVRLLPDEQFAHVRRAVASAERGHFGPARALVSLPPGLLARHREDRRIPAQAALHERRAAPEGEVRGVPPMHLQMEFSIPTVARQASLLRRSGTGALDGREVLREHHAALQLGGARIGAAAEIERAAGGPEGLPMFLAGGAGFSGRGCVRGEIPGSEFAGEVELGASQQNAVRARGFGARVAGPVQAHPVAVGIQPSSERGRIRKSGDHARFVPVGAVPVGRIDGCRAVGKVERNRQRLRRDKRRFHRYGNRVAGRMAAGPHVNRLSAEPERAIEEAGPQVEALADVADLFAPQHPAIEEQSNSGKIQAMRVLAQPVKKRFLAFAAGGIAHRPAVGVEIFQAQLRGGEAVRQGRAVPTPLRLHAQRDSGFVWLGERLQAGDIGGKRELAVADRKRTARVQVREGRIMPADKAPAVDGAVCGTGGLGDESCAGEIQEIPPGSAIVSGHFSYSAVLCGADTRVCRGRTLDRGQAPAGAPAPQLRSKPVRCSG